MGDYMKMFFIIVLISLQTKADTEEQLEKKYMSTMMECFKKSGLTEADLAEMQNSKKLDTEKKKCMYACAYKATGMMNEKGMMDVENLKKIAKETVGSDAKNLELALKSIDECKSVNDQPVSDGEKGCDRAALMFNCSLDKGSEIAL